MRDFFREIIKFKNKIMFDGIKNFKVIFIKKTQ